MVYDHSNANDWKALPTIEAVLNLPIRRQGLNTVASYQLNQTIIKSNASIKEQSTIKFLISHSV